MLSTINEFIDSSTRRGTRERLFDSEDCALCPGRRGGIRDDVFFLSFFRRMEMPNSVHSRHRLITLILCCVNIRANREKLWRARRITPEFCRGNIGYVNLHQPEDVFQVDCETKTLFWPESFRAVKSWEAAHFTLVLLFNLCLITWRFCYMYR